MERQTSAKIIITPGRTSIHYWKDIVRYRELFYVLSWRDLKVRYKQTFIGLAWAVLRPLLTMAILTLVFGYFAKLPTTGDIPYPLLVFSGLIPWQFFTNSTSESGNSLIDNRQLISKVYFPRLIIPLSATVTSFVDFLIAILLLGLFMVIYGYTPPWQVIFLPVIIVLLFLLAFGFGALLTALNVKYRDFRYVLPFIIQIGLYISPVGYGTGVVPNHMQMVYSLNPMVGIIEGFRYCLLGESSLNFSMIMFSVIICMMIFALGIWYFRRTERFFADII